MIYFIRGKESGNIKIGYSTNPKQRKANLQTANYEELEFIGLMDGTIKDESKLKKIFLEFNIRGEWYRPVTEILNYIEQNKNPRKNIVSSLGDGTYRITFVEPFKFTMNFFLLAGSHRMKILSDSDAEFVFGVEGKKEVLISWLNSLNGVTQEAINEFASSMTD